ncbi:MAG: cystathionine beta-lyase [Desulfobacterales bacterium]|nr:MAG: cystathionine beta-lyase [Desulfobacterales bacterium]
MGKNTDLVHLGRDPMSQHGVVSTPVYHASTIIYPTIAAFKNRAAGDRKYRGVRYGAYGTPTTFALADTVAQLEGGVGGVVTSSGLAAATMALTAFLNSGDHLLMVDSVYPPTREFCNSVLVRLGVETTYYDPLIGADIAGLIRSNTRVVFTESPGSLTFEVQDIPAIAAAAHQRNALILLDNTWATPLFFKPFAHGVDISIQAATKYIAGGSDLVIGIITAAEEKYFRQLKDTTLAFGEIAAPDDCYQALKGMRSMGARLKQQQAAALDLARWLQARSEVKRVLYPALEGNPGHHLWQRDFTGASSLFGVLLHETSEEALARMVDNYSYFKIGASWGGFESLVVPADPAAYRTAPPWDESGYLLRYHIGLEDPQDLISDLADGFKRLN